MKKNEGPTAQAKNVQIKFRLIPTPIQMKAINRKLVKEFIEVELRDCKCHLMNGEYAEAYCVLQRIFHIHEPARVALYKILAYGLDGKELDLNVLIHHMRNAAADGHIPSMRQLAKLFKAEVFEDKYGEAELWMLKASILDPGRERDSDLFNPESTSRHLLVKDVLEALDEGMDSFYNNEEAAQKAAAIPISLPFERTFIEILGGSNCEALLAQTVEPLHKGEYDTVESLLKQASEYDNVAALIFAAQLYDGIGRKEDFFDNIEMAASYGSVPSMFTLSACYRCGYGVEKSDDYADAWFWMASQYDIDNRGLKEAILLNV